MTVDHLGKTFVERTLTERTEYWAELGYVDGAGVGYWKDTYYSSGPYADRRDAVDHLLQHPDMERCPGLCGLDGTGFRNGRGYGAERVRVEIVRVPHKL